MPVKDGIGYGEYTGVKIEHLSNSGNAYGNHSSGN